MSGTFKVNRIKSRHKEELALLGDVVTTAQEAIPKLGQSVANRVAFRNMEQTMSAVGKLTRATGFDPTMTFQHVANVDTEVWTLVLDMFAKHDPDTGELMDDGLLYKYDPDAGAVKLYKPFFFAIIDYLESAGYPCDMRGKIKLT